MKRRLAMCIVISALVALMATPIFATTEILKPVTTTDVEVYDDGSYAVIETVIEQSGISVRATTNTKSASRTYTYYNASNVKAWDFTVKGTFSYNGSTAKATAVSTSYNTYVSGWSLSSRDSSKSGATVSATAKFRHNLVTKSISIGMKCSASGAISAI